MPIANPKKFYGKYRGTVTNNIDPLKMGRVQVIVPDVSNVSLSSWATPCVPLLGLQLGIYTVPQGGSGVWVEFEHGDPDKPVWTGCFPGSLADVPVAAQPIIPLVAGITLQTTMLNSLVVSDMPPSPVTGGIVLRSASGATIAVNDSGIYINNGKGASIILSGPTVTINNGALVIT